MAANLDAVLGIKGGSMSNILQVVNALADEDEQVDRLMLRSVAREPFEEVRRDLALPLASGGEVVVPVADPSSLVAASIRASDTMQAIFMSALQSHPCTLANTLESFGHMERVHAWEHAQPQQAEEMHGGELLLPGVGGCVAQRPMLVDHGCHQVLDPRASGGRLVSRSARLAEDDINGRHWDAARRHSSDDPGCVRCHL